QVSDLLFGQSKVTTRPDPSVVTGWQHRGFNWQATASIQQQLLSGIAVSAGYYRTWYGNFRVTDNLAVTPADYDQYCIPGPFDARLPGGGGGQICDLYDLKTAKLGQVDNLVRLAQDFGKQTEVYNGMDLNVAGRLPRGAQISGGLSVG